MEVRCHTVNPSRTLAFQVFVHLFLQGVELAKEQQVACVAFFGQQVPHFFLEHLQINYIIKRFFILDSRRVLHPAPSFLAATNLKKEGVFSFVNL